MRQVEVPPGDQMRSFLLKFQSSARKKRDVSVFFEANNAGKRMVQIDVKRDRPALMRMLANADVFLTNVRQHQLEKLGLQYEQLKKECPRLLYCHLTAWGRVGHDATLPGFDVSSFWSATGLAAQVHGPWMYSCCK